MGSTLRTLGLIAVLGCSGTDSASDAGSDGAAPPVLREFGEPCVATEDCESRLCLEVATGAAICTRVCDGDGDCPEGPNWGCVEPAQLSARICGCSLLSDSEICGDGVDNDCNGVVDDCRVCDGRPVPDDDREHCGRCGNACRFDQSCISGECRCTSASATDCGDFCTDLQQDPSHCGACSESCATGQQCNEGTCECPESQSLCDGACRLTDTDRSHCGSCGNACVGMELCLNGDCACPDAGTLCGTECVDLDSNASHCGRCAEACGPGLVCTDGSCQCPSATPDRCADICTDMSTDTSHCGSCGAQCASVQTCIGGSCVCPVSGQVLCGVACVDLQSDEAHCGGCDAPCHPAHQCIDGGCRCPRAGDVICNDECVSTSTDSRHCSACNAPCGPFTICRDSSCQCPLPGETPCADGCRNLGLDTLNCGMCGLTCVPGEICQGGACLCQSDVYCDGICMDLNDPSNCGGCDIACGTQQLCSGGACTCSASGLSPCGTECVHLPTDLAHCGGCDVVCRPTELCVSGVCQCPTSLTYCDSATACVDTSTDIDHCGGCDQACGSTLLECTGGGCQCISDSSLIYCAATDECTEVLTDPDNCGECGTVCTPSESCQQGVCRVASCGDGYREKGPSAERPLAPARESCDDGNLLEGDACSSTCESTLHIAIAEARPPVISTPEPAIGVDGRGELFVVWREHTTLDDVLFGQRFSRVGLKIGDPVLIDDAGRDWDEPRVLGLPAGGWIIAYTNWQLTFTQPDVMLVSVRADGTLAGSRVAHEERFSQQVDPTLALLDNGYVVAWETTGTLAGDPSGSVWARRFNGLNPIDAAEFKVNTTGIGQQRNPRVASFGNQWMAIWTHNPGLDPGEATYARRYNGSQPTDSVDFEVAPYTITESDVAWTHTHYTVTYPDGGDLYVREVPLSGSPLAPIAIANDPAADEGSPVIASLRDSPAYAVLYRFGTSRSRLWSNVPLPPEGPALSTILYIPSGGRSLTPGPDGLWVGFTGRPTGSPPTSFNLFLLPYD